MVGVAQLVRALDCGSRGRGFKSHHPPKLRNPVSVRNRVLFFKGVGSLLTQACKNKNRRVDVVSDRVFWFGDPQQGFASYLE